MPTTRDCRQPGPWPNTRTNIKPSKQQRKKKNQSNCLKNLTGALPLNGGLKAQLIITTSQEDLDRRDGRGTAFTVHSGPVPLSLFDQSLCDPEITRLSYGIGQEIL